MLKGLFPFLRLKEIQAIIKNLVSEIEKDYTKDYTNREELILVCPLKASLFFLSDLIRALSLPTQVDFVMISRQKNESFKITKDISLNLKKKDVLIVEEIVESGLRLAFLKERLKLSEPRSLKTLVLLDKSSHRKTPIHPDYIGKSIEDRFVLGYGMDLNEEGRNYPDIYHLGQ